MKKLIDFPLEEKFFRGTIIVIKDSQFTPKGVFDKRYCMIGNVGSGFAMLDLYRGIGSCIIHNLNPNVKGAFACNKEGIKEWCREYFELFYTPEGYKEWSEKLDDIIYIEDLSDYFIQSNRDLFMS